MCIRDSAYNLETQKGKLEMAYIFTENGILGVAVNEKRTRAQLEWIAAEDGSKIMRENGKGAFQIHVDGIGGIAYAMTPTTLIALSPEQKFSYSFGQSCIDSSKIIYIDRGGDSILIRGTLGGGEKVNINILSALPLKINSWVF